MRLVNKHLFGSVGEMFDRAKLQKESHYQYSWKYVCSIRFRTEKHLASIEK